MATFTAKLSGAGQSDHHLMWFKMKHLLLCASSLIAPALAAGQSVCLGSHDTNGNGTVDIEDFLSILGVFGDVDSDGDGVWDSLDLCTDPEACNLDAVPTEPCLFYDATGICGGDCDTDSNEDGFCDFAGCGNLWTYQGYHYSTVQIGDQCWFGENLRNEFYSNGDAIPLNETSVYGETDSYCQSYAEGMNACNPAESLSHFGRLYTWYAVIDSAGLCPTGWHVPSDLEWTEMTDFLGGEYAAGPKLKSTSGWFNEGNGTNESGFTGLPAGEHNEIGEFWSAGRLGDWWSSTWCCLLAYDRRLTDYDHGMERAVNYLDAGLSVRCIQDAE